MKMNIIHKLFRRLGRELTHPPKALAYNHLAQLRPSIGLIVTYLASLRPNFFFVQVGANDGKRDDPIHEYVERFRLRGILIEPQPKTFESLKATYAHRPDLVLVNAAIAPVDGKVTIYQARSPDGSEPWVDLLTSFDLTTLRKTLGPRSSALVEQVEVRAVSPATLLAEHTFNQVDLLQVDTEGYDYEVLKLFDLPLLRPSIVHFEHRLLKRADWESAIELLVSNNYMVSYNWHDTLACHRSLVPQEYIDS
jgi:FkbM family methyltransferase